MAHVIQDYVLRDGTGTGLARIVGGDAAALVIADITAAEYTAYLLDADDQTERTAIAGHIGVAIAPADLLYDELQTDACWTADTTGYNFRHTLDVSANPIFELSGRQYLIVFKLTPAVGQVIIVHFLITTVVP